MTKRLFIHGAGLLDPESAAPTLGVVLVEDGRIEAILPPASALPRDARPIDLTGRMLAPGFIDLHYHGGLIFLDAPDYAAASSASSASMVRHGVTGFLPTTVAWSQPDLLERVGALAELVRSGEPSGAAALGIHLEGPWISPEAAGAQPAQGIRPPAPIEVAEVLARGEGEIRMVTFAPELAGADALQAELARRDVVGALGHSRARTDQVDVAIERGASHVTHLFNAMAPLHHRAPGLAGAALADDRLSCDLICDGAHVHPTAVRAAARALSDRLVLITDRVEPPTRSGETDAQSDGGQRKPAPPGATELRGGAPAPTACFGSGSVTDDGVAIRFPDGNLAGSSVTLDLAMRNLRDFASTSLLDAVKACTLRPARVLGIESQRGTLRRGARADFVVLDAAGRVLQTWIAGRRVHAANP